MVLGQTLVGDFLVQRGDCSQAGAAVQDFRGALGELAAVVFVDEGGLGVGFFDFLLHGRKETHVFLHVPFEMGQHCGVVAHIGRRRHLHFLGLNLYGLATPRHVEPEDFLVEDFAFFGLGDHLKGQFVVINEFFEGAGRNMPGKDGHLCSKCVVK